MLKGGFGSEIIEFMGDNDYHAKVKRLGIPDYFVEHGSQQELYHECGFDAAAIEKTIREMVEIGERGGFEEWEVTARKEKGLGKK